MRTTNYTLKRRLAPVHSPYLPGHPQAVLTEIYIEALLVDEGLADQVWEAFFGGEIDGLTASLAWSAVAYSCESKASEGASGLLLKPSRTHIRKLDK